MFGYNSRKSIQHNESIKYVLLIIGVITYIDGLYSGKSKGRFAIHVGQLTAKRQRQ